MPRDFTLNKIASEPGMPSRSTIDRWCTDRPEFKRQYDIAVQLRVHRPFAAKGRSRGDAPQIDGAVFVSSRRPLRIGEIATVKIERADAYDLHGTAVGF